MFRFSIVGKTWAIPECRLAWERFFGKKRTRKRLRPPDETRAAERANFHHGGSQERPWWFPGTTVVKIGNDRGESFLRLPPLETMAKRDRAKEALEEIFGGVRFSGRKVFRRSFFYIFLE